MILKSVILNDILRKGAKLPLLGMLCLAMGLSSCDSVFDDDPNCLHGIALRFVYDYHMERGANAFPANVDCVNVLVFDSIGNFVKEYKETSRALANESYRMNIELDNGKYHLMVYGGTACDKSIFDLTPHWGTADAEGAKQKDVLVTLPRNAQGVSDKELHNIEDDKRSGGLFYGTLDVELTEDDYAVNYREETVYLMNDVNNIQVILQELDQPDKANYEDYIFQIVDDNFVLDYNNKPIHVATADYQLIYKPYDVDNRDMGYVEYDDEDEVGTLLVADAATRVQVACAEFSTSRLLMEHYATARLQIFSSSEKDKDGNPNKLVDIPLIEYLTATWGFGDRWIKSKQEYLDRQHRWTLMFFLQHGRWVNARISVNSWVVRLNNIEF